MKLVREHINEKFEEESDPIEDLGIGIYKMLEPYSLKNLSNTSDNSQKIRIYISKLFELSDSKIYLLGNFTDFINQNQSSKLYNILYQAKAVDHIGSKTIGLDINLSIYDTSYGKVLIERSPHHTISVWGGYKVALYILGEKIEIVNEKFDEESDPIEDLGIGITSKGILECIEKFFELDKNEKNIFDYWFLPNEMNNYYFVVVIKYGTKISEENLIRYSTKLLKKSYLINFLEIPNIASLMWRVKSKYSDIFKEAFKYSVGYNIDESINEKFEEESDPIHDMGIGGYSFETLKPGALIQLRDDIHSSVALTYNQSGQFTSWHSGMKISTEDLLLVTKIIDYDYIYKCIHFRKFRDRQRFNEYRENFKKTGKIEFGGTPNNMIVSKKMFNNRFKIIDKGF